MTTADEVAKLIDAARAKAATRDDAPPSLDLIAWLNGLDDAVRFLASELDALRPSSE